MRSTLPAIAALRYAVAPVAIAGATVVVAVVEGRLGVPDASSVYLVAVVLTAIAVGTAGAVLAAVGSIVVYDFLFTHPRQTLIVADPGEWLNLVVLLFVAVTVGQLAALQRHRAEVALAREREARALFQVTRALATRASTDGVLPLIAETLATEAGMDRVWFALGVDDRTEQVVAVYPAGTAAPRLTAYAVLHRQPGVEPAKWTLVREPSGRSAGPHEARVHRVHISAAGRRLGSIWATRSRASGEPDRTATRLLAAAADQVGQAIAQDSLARQAQHAEIARESDALKSALLESVSHDLRTPLASIRASAGTLMDPDVEVGWDDVRSSAASIDREAERLNALVANLLDLGRIEGGALRAAADALDVDDLVSRAVEIVRPRLGGRLIELDIQGAPTVTGDAILVEEALLNVLDNAIRHTSPDVRVRVSSSALPDDEFVRLTIEDSGAGVADADLPRLFEKFYRGNQPAAGRRAGTGIGLAVVRGLVAAMHGQVDARRSDLGGLAVDIDLPVARVPATIGLE
jgi:two-component system, OmpR family, sensor histidine kinase KdpD